MSKLSQSSCTKSPLGYFKVLPNEMFFKILCYLSIEDLTLMANTSSEICQFIISTYIFSKHGLGRFNGSQGCNILSEVGVCINCTNHLNTIPTTIGYFVKRCTIVLSMDIRIQHLMEIFVQTFGIPTFEIVQKYDYQTVCQVSMSYGKIIDSFIAGWPISEVYKVYDYLFDICEIGKIMIEIDRSIIENDFKMQLYIRLFFRMIFNSLQKIGTRIPEKLKWLLMKIINDDNVSYKYLAKMMILIFGPLNVIDNGPDPEIHHYIPWDQLSNQSFINNFKDFGFIVSTFYHNCDYLYFDEQDVIELFEEIISTNFQWLNRNVAALLVYCGINFSIDFLSYKLEESVNDVCSYLIYMNIISYRQNHSFNKFIRLANVFLSELGPVFVGTYFNIVQENILNIDDEEFEIFDFVHINLHLLQGLYAFNADNDN